MSLVELDGRLTRPWDGVFRQGGLKAVVWTDVFQLGIMVAGFLSVIVRAVVLQGGVAAVMADSDLGGRLNLWE